MCKKRYHLILMAITVLTMALMFSGCSDKLDEPVFVKNLVCSSDMDAEIEFITDDDFNLKAIGVEIPDIPEDLHLDFYDEAVDHYRGYDLHCLNIGVGADELSESGGLKEDFIFHEVIVKWDDGSETRADIGTIHMMESYEQAFTFDWAEWEATNPSDDMQAVVADHIAAEDLSITNIEIPYNAELSGLIKDMKLGGKVVSDITEKHPFAVEKGKTYFLTYTEDTSVQTEYGRIFLECKIIGIDKQGKEHINMFYIQGNENRVMPEWVYEQLENAEQE